MASLLRRKFVCFYCGCRSAQTRTPNVRRWKCVHCEAENFLDENGEIADPPAEDISSNVRYAQALARPTPSGFEIPDDSLFCPTCLKNQHLVSQALASYLPPPDAPDYAEYVKAESEYRQGLEERYPQVCKRCEPKVQERLRAAGYAAKTDHLRRMMDRTRGYGIQYRDASWGAPLITLGGIGWFLSLAGQILWDGLSLVGSTEESHGLRDPQILTSGSVCLQRVVRGSAAISDCTELLYSAAGLALILGFLSSWWNPVLKETLTRKGARAVGTAEFYQLQGLFLTVRCVIWWYLPSFASTVQRNKAAHLSLLVFATIINGVSFRSTYMDYTAPVKFQDSPGFSVSQTTQQKASGVGARGLENIHQQTVPSLTRNNGGMRPFSITDFAPPNMHPRPSVYQPPTPPPDNDDDEAMDWTPSQENKTLRPALSYRSSNPVSQQLQSFPYRDTHTANAVHGLRNPLNQPRFDKSSDSQSRVLYKTPKKNTMRESYDESPFATPYEPSLAAGSPDLSPISFAQPRFFPTTDREDLGLESLMANNFSLAETPREVRARQQQYEKSRKETQSKLDEIYSQWNGPAALFLLAISCMVWTSTPLPYLAAFRTQLRLAALCISALVILKSLLPALRKASDRSHSDIVILAFELIITIAFGVVLRQQAVTTALEDGIGSLEKPGIVLIAALVAQEARIFYSRTWGHPMDNGGLSPPPASQSAVTPDTVERPRPFSGGSMPSSRPDPKMGTGISSNGQHLPASSQRTARPRTKFQNENRTQGGFSSLSLGGNSRNEQEAAVNSLSLGQSQRRNRNGMW